MASSPPLVGGPAPAFELKTVNNDNFKFSDLKGQFVVINFWATWCATCVYEMPEFKKLHQSSSGKNVRVISINFAEKQNKVEKYVLEKQLDFPVLLDGYGSIAGMYKVKHIPATFLISPDGIVQEKIVGLITQEIIESKINGYNESIKKAGFFKSVKNNTL
ncbi:MAG: TlpA family protein disulfide reductase [Nitrospinales bacterium]